MRIFQVEIDSAIANGTGKSGGPGAGLMSDRLIISGLLLALDQLACENW
jgi:hypothetical protein